MNYREITENILSGSIDSFGGRTAVLWSGGKQSSVLWHMASSTGDCTPVFIDHGLHPQETHELLHQLYRKGNFTPDIRRNDDALQAIENNTIHASRMKDGGEELRNMAGGDVPFTLGNFAAKQLLFTKPYVSIFDDYDLVLSGERKDRGRENYYLHYTTKQGKAVMVLPLLHWTEQEVWEYIRTNDVPVNARYAKGYRIVDSVNDHLPDSRPAWEQEMMPGSETQVDLEKIAAVRRLKDMGYLKQSLGVAGQVNGEKAGETYRIIADAINRYDKIAVAWSVGKDSTTVAWMAQSIRPDIPVLFLDTGAHFTQTIDYASLIRLLFRWNVISLRNPLPYDGYAKDKVHCCFSNKIRVLHDYVASNGIQAVLTGIRKQDGYGREKSVVEESRTTYSGQRYVQVNPLLEWEEREVRAFLQVNGIPTHPMYDGGYRSIDCEPCCLPNEDMSKFERAGRVEKDSTSLVQLRKMGYF